MFNVKIIGADQSAPTGAPAFAKDLQVVTSPARLYTATVYNSNAAQRFFQLFDATAEPVDGTVPKMVMPVPSQNTWSFEFTDGKMFGSGVYMCLSTTDTSKTKTAANDGLFDATFRKTE